MLYVRLGCGLRSVVKILEIFSEVMGPAFGKIPCHKTVEDWVKKLGLSVYEDDPTPEEMSKYAIIQDESIWVNKEKLLLTLGIPADFINRPVGHADARILDMRVGKSFTGDEVRRAAEDATAKAGAAPEYAITDQGHNLVNGLGNTDITHYIDVSHAVGTCFKKVYAKQDDFKELSAAVGRAHLQFQLTDSAYLLPPNMRAIARFMNMSQWVRWGMDMIGCYDILSEKERDDYAFVMEYKPLFEELHAGIKVADYIETLLKKEGLCDRTAALCQHRIIFSLCGTPNNRLAALGVQLLDYIVKQRAKLPDKATVVNVSSDIIESSFGIFKAKKSPNKLYGVTPLVLMMPLYPKIVNMSVTKNIDFKERLATVKLADVDAWAKEHLSENMVSKRIKTLKQRV